MRTPGARPFRRQSLIAHMVLFALGVPGSALGQLLMRDTAAQCVSVPRNELNRLPPAQDNEAKRLPLFPEGGLLEIGLLAGLFFPSPVHDLRRSDAAEIRYGSVTSSFGARAAYFPLSFLGLEAEGAVMPTKVNHGGSALLWALRGHFVAQLPSGGVTPFAAIGYGALGGTSDEMGQGALPALHFGLGAKTAIDRTLSVRIDLRDSIGRANPSTGGMAHYPEILLGLTLTFGRSQPVPAPPVLPDNDGDGVPNDRDGCPSRAARTQNGCPEDTDIDGVPDESDRCPTEAGPRPTGCPVPNDRDRDGVEDVGDACPDTFGAGKNGCPDPDPDRDFVLGDQDRCPIDAETPNGRDDSDGCPD